MILVCLGSMVHSSSPHPTYLVPQHPFQPVLTSSSQVDGQGGTTALHHHHRLRQKLVGQTHHNLEDTDVGLFSFSLQLFEMRDVTDGSLTVHFHNRLQ